MVIRLSIIIPCYNSAKTIIRCLDSIYALPLPEQDFEVIAVNDGSTDETQTLLEEYARQHTQLTIIRHLVNRNLGAARNTGLAAAIGAAVAFLDSDDEVTPGLATALNCIEERNLDMIAMRAERVKANKNVIDEISLSTSSDEVFSGIWLQEMYPFWNYGGCTNYLYLKSFLDRVNYPFVEGAFYEDVDFVCAHLYKAGRMSYSDICGYLQYINPLSITHTFSPKHVFSYAFLGVRMLLLYDGLHDKECTFARYILEGGSFNLKKAFLNLFRLKNISEVKQFYNLFDSKTKRKYLLKFKKPSYCWTFWTRFGLRHRHLASYVSGLGGSIRNTFLRNKALQK